MFKIFFLSLFFALVLYYMIYQANGPAPKMFAYLGLYFCLFLGSLGTVKGINSISKYVGGASITTPRVGTKSILGTVICEAGMICSVIHCVRMYSRINSMADTYKNSAIVFASGVSVGASFYFTSICVGIICGTISLMDSKDPSLFFGIVALEIIPSSIGLLGFVLGNYMAESIE